MVNDPISDFLTQIRNSYLARKTHVVVSYSKVKEELADVLKKEGYIKDANVKTRMSKHQKKELNIIEIELKYDNGKPAVTTITRASSPGRKLYVGKRNIPYVLSGYGTAVITTSQGLMTDSMARKKHIGGEVVCYIS